MHVKRKVQYSVLAYLCLIALMVLLDLSFKDFFSGGPQSSHFEGNKACVSSVPEQDNQMKMVFYVSIWLSRLLRGIFML